MGSPLDSTFGFWLVSTWLQTLLQGCGMLQAMVVTLAVIETFQIVIWFQITYFYFIDGFGNVPGLFLIHWRVIPAQLFATYLSAYIVQMYFAYCIYVLDRKNKIIPGIIAVLALTQIASGLAQTIITLRLTSFTRLDSTKPIITQAASALLCDIMITVSLVRSLRKHKGNVKSTNSLLNSLVINAVNRGILTAMCAALNLILFVALPGTFYFFIGLEMSGKLYMNSAMATYGPSHRFLSLVLAYPLAVSIHANTS
ncbi:hypothetical protein BDZ97DRAFT_1191886 [Flammula alnicola]|nr:hypothetical protein BDZ97DRAFT_1191886 [Flammula alnicola]